MADGRPATLHLETWAGRTKHAVDVIGETPQRYRVRTERGDVKLVPKRAVTFECAFCGKPDEGQHSIHRDGFDVGPEVALCNACGGGTSPTCEEIWARTRVHAHGYRVR